MKCYLLSAILFIAVAPSFTLRGSSIRREFMQDRKLQHEDSFLWTEGLGSSVIVGGKFDSILPTDIDDPDPATSSSSGTCFFEPDSFVSNIIIDFEGDEDAITPEGIKSLQNTMVKTYDETRATLCDQTFRQMFNVELVKPTTGSNSRRALVESSSGRPTRRFSFRFYVLGVCRACKKDAKLFNDAFRRRMKEEQTYEYEYEYDFEAEHHRHLYKHIDHINYATNVGGSYSNRPQDVPDIFMSKTTAPAVTQTSPRSCTCRDPQALNMAPSTRLYKAKLNDNVLEARVDGISRVLAVTEVDEVECASDLREFHSAVVMDCIGKPESITDDELSRLGTAFVSTYNRLANLNCDPQFRTIQFAEFSLETNPVATAGDAIDIGRKLQRADRFRLRVAVTGICKSCQEDSALFDYALRRTLGEATPAATANEFPSFREPLRQLGYIVNNETCYCAVNAPPRPINMNDFAWAFNTTVNALVAVGTITNLEIISSATQVDETLPSTSPSISPTNSPAPSVAPSMTPTTLAPSGRPTLVPSLLPTQPPTVIPSFFPSTQDPTLLPTAPPSFFPTEQPTMSPTNFPTITPSLFPTTNTPTLFPTGQPTMSPTNFPTITPSLFPTTTTPTLFPTGLPTMSPTNSPTVTPSSFPTTNTPTLFPTDQPTMSPTNFPTITPSTFPTTTTPTLFPTEQPTMSPTNSPTVTPSLFPTTTTPTLFPTEQPTMSPTYFPTNTPSSFPTTNTLTLFPTEQPSFSPTYFPTISPSLFPSTDAPTLFPTGQPSLSPSDVPTNTPSIMPTTEEPTPMPFPTESPKPSPSPSLMPSIF